MFSNTKMIGINYVPTLKNVIPDIIFSNMKESIKQEESNKQIFHIEQKTRFRTSNKKRNVKRKLNNGKCHTCGK